MNMLPFYLPPHEDEFLFSWILRMTQFSGLSFHSFLQLFAEQEPGTPAIQYNALNTSRSDSRLNFIKLSNSLPVKITPHDLFLTLTNLQYESLFLSKGQQTRIIHNAFRPFGKLNHTVQKQYSAFRICPLCAKEDIEKHGTIYYHRAHHITDVQTCCKHHTRLFSIPFSDYPDVLKNEIWTELSSDVDIDALNQYTDYAYEIFKAGIHTDRTTVIQVVNEKMFQQHGENWFQNKDVISRWDTWPYNELKKLTEFDYVKTPRRIKNVTDNTIFFILIMMAFEDVHEFIDKVRQDEPIIESYICNTCGNIYYDSPQAYRDGWGCPQCEEKLSAQELYSKLVETSTNGEYIVTGSFVQMAKPVELLHKRCNQTVSITPTKFLFEQKRCSCENRILENEIRERIESVEGFHLVHFQGANNPITLLHEKCGKTFETKVHEFLKTKGCKHCEGVKTNQRNYSR